MVTSPESGPEVNAPKRGVAGIPFMETQITYEREREGINAKERLTMCAFDH